MEQFNEFKEQIKYKKRLKGIELTKKDLNPETFDVQTEEQLEELGFQLPERIVEIRTEPLFGNRPFYTALISEERANRPGLKKQKPQFDEEDIGMIFGDYWNDLQNLRSPLSSKRPGFGTLSAILKDYNRVKLSRAGKNSDFRKPRVFYETAVPKIFHEGGIISVLNLCPYIHPNFVTIFTDEFRADLSDITNKDIAAYLQTGKEIANILKNEGYDGMWDFINWGPEAGGTQIWPHAQRGALYKRMFNETDEESAIIAAIVGEQRTDPFERYMNLVRDSPLFVYENDYVFVHTPFAPKFTDQVDILTKRKGVRNYLNLESEEIEAISESMANVLRKIRKIEYKKEIGGKLEDFTRETTNLNIETHQERFGREGHYRMHWHIYPRESKLAGMEMMRIYIISAYPEDTSKALKF